ncbi:GNAT family N-acetyltransferase [Lactobacillus sp. R2/2]|nr:GNAT family N-acetyltransferase [Lactobacillus sp. R2/2]
MANSLFAIGAYDQNQLVGLIRVVGDGLTIIYIQDLLVNPAYQRRGIGTKLINNVLKKYKSVRQKVLLTENTVKTRMFYESCDFNPCDKYDLIAFTKIFKRYKESGKTIFSQTFCSIFYLLILRRAYNNLINFIMVRTLLPS